MDYLIGKCVKATCDIELSNNIVDDKFYSVSSFWIPKIYKDHFYMIKSVNGDTVQLQNLSSDDWKICELTLDDIEDFKIVSKDSI